MGFVFNSMYYFLVLSLKYITLLQHIVFFNLKELNKDNIT